MEEKKTEGIEELSEEKMRPETQAEVEEEAKEATREGGIAEETEAEKEAQEEAAGKAIYVEEREVRGAQLMDTLEELLRESTVRRVKIKNKAGRVILDIPVWVAAVGGAAAVIAVPVISVISVFGGAVAGFKLEIEREEK